MGGERKGKSLGIRQICAFRHCCDASVAVTRWQMSRYLFLSLFLLAAEDGERRPKPCRPPVPPPRSFERPSKRDLKFSLNQPRGRGNSRIAEPEWEEERGCKQNGRVSEFDPSQRRLFSCKVLCKLFVLFHSLLKNSSNCLK